VGEYSIVFSFVPGLYGMIRKHSNQNSDDKETNENHSNMDNTPRVHSLSISYAKEKPDSVRFFFVNY